VLWLRNWKLPARPWPDQRAMAKTAKKHPNHRLVKTHRSYSVEEIARLFDAHKNTVRAWIKAGLPTNDEKRPFLILGTELAAFLQARRGSKKHTCEPGELYCVRCRVPRFPAGGMADCLPVTEKIGHLQAICPDCFCMMNRRISLAKLKVFREILAIRFTQESPHVSNTTQPNVNSDFTQGGSDDAKTLPRE
jgi:hypothetical protein